MTEKQHTIAKSAKLEGIGLHTGASVQMTFHPAPPNHGFVFKRVDLPSSPLIRAEVDNVVSTARGTTIAEKGVMMHTVEHTLAALAGLKIDNVLIEVNGPEPPIMDGSAKDFAECLKASGLEEQTENREYWVIDERIDYKDPRRDVELRITPSPIFQAKVEIDFNSDVLKPQKASLENLDDFLLHFADSRTFCFLHELEYLYSQGLIKGGGLDSAVVIVDKEVSEEKLEQLRTWFNVPYMEIRQGVLNNGFRYENEPARHKLLDLIGDLALLGKPIKGQIWAKRPGHEANVQMAKRIKAKIKEKQIISKFQQVEKEGIIFDINAIQRILPHRYPFLLVDKIVDFSEKSIIGVKNITINEPFFNGHFPGNPIMPGVLQIEAMAQVGGILLLNTIENPQTVWVYIAAIDNARFKKPVIPGDVLVLQLELIAMKRGICKMKGKAFVDNQLVCETDLTASIIPKKSL